MKSLYILYEERVASFLGTLARVVKCSSVSPWQAAGVWGASLAAECSASLSGGGHLQLRISCFLKCSEEGKTKTLYNLLNSLRSLTLRFWINQKRVSGYRVTSPFMRLNAVCDKERRDSESLQFSCSKTHRKTSSMLSMSVRHLSEAFLWSASNARMPWKL